MKSRKKVVITILTITWIIIITACIVIQIVLKNMDKELEKESQKYETLITETKSGDKIETEYTRINEEKFYIKIPKSFHQLDSETIAKKYNGEVPNIVFSNDETTINIAISLTKNQMKDSKIKEYTQYMNNLLKDTNQMINTNVYQVDGHNIGQLKLISNASDTKIYNNMICFSYNDKLVIVTFNCTEKLQDEWFKVGDFIIKSLFFKE